MIDKRRRRGSDDYNDLPTARTTLAARYVRVLVFCNSCRHSADADLQAIVDAGQSYVPLPPIWVSDLYGAQQGHADL